MSWEEMSVSSSHLKHIVLVQENIQVVHFVVLWKLFAFVQCLYFVLICLSCKSLIITISEFFLSVTVVRVFDRLRRATALTARDQEENFVSRSQRLVFSTVSVFSVCTFLTSGSPTLSAMVSFVGSCIFFSQRK